MLLFNTFIIYLFFRCDEPPIEVQLQQIRPHSSEILPRDQLKVGDKVLMNYNVEHPQERGYWYDVLVKDIKSSRRGHDIIGDVSVGMDNAVLVNCHLMFHDDIYIVKPYKLLADRTPEDDKIMKTQPKVLSNKYIIYLKLNTIIICVF